MRLVLEILGSLVVFGAGLLALAWLQYRLDRAILRRRGRLHVPGDPRHPLDHQTPLEEKAKGKKEAK